MKIAIFHFNPIEMYPPVMNLIRVLEKELPADIRIIVFTTKPAEKNGSFQSVSKQISIRRIGSNTQQLNAMLRYFNYLRYFLAGMANCLFAAPDKIFYYESMSALVPFILKKYLTRKARLFIHYHEYMTVDDYQRMYLSGRFHRLEKKIYGEASWISHTNSDRLQFFLDDIGHPELGNTHVYPNYPLKDWGIHKANYQMTVPIRLVCVGSFGSMETMYIKETLEWVKAQNGKLTLDVYSFNVPEKIRTYSHSLNCPFIKILDAANYYDVPGILKNYDVGLILYKGGSLNVEYCEPNKLFEYLACGLDVWYSEQVRGIWKHDSVTQWPRVIRLNFEKLDQFVIEELIDRKPADERIINFTCEEASRPLINKLLSDSK